VLELRRSPGGASKENFSFDLEWSEAGQRRREELLLRMDPGEAIVETHRLREFQLIRAVAGALPAPKVYWVDADGEWLGRPFLVMQRMPGKTQPELGGKASGVGIAFDPSLRERLAPQFVEALVGLHAIPWREKDLSAFEAPAEGTTEAAEWNLNWWQRVWEEDRVEDHPVVVLAAAWLRERLPRAAAITLVHGDFRSGNFLYTDDGRIQAFLDWELGHLGDPHEDLAWVTSRLFAVPGEGGELLACGLFTEEDFVRRYEAASGLRVDAERLRYYQVFNNYKLAIICQSTNLRAARDERTHLPAMMNLIHVYGYVFTVELARDLGFE